MKRAGKEKKIGGSENGISVVISKNMKKYRLLNHMTQEQMAEKLYIDTQYYVQLERGIRGFTIEKIVAACAVFHIGIENIIEIEKVGIQENESEFLQTELSEKIKSLSYRQLILTERFISDVLPFAE